MIVKRDELVVHLEYSNYEEILEIIQRALWVVKYQRRGFVVRSECCKDTADIFWKTTVDFTHDGSLAAMNNAIEFASLYGVE